MYIFIFFRDGFPAPSSDFVLAASGSTVSVNHNLLGKPQKSYFFSGPARGNRGKGLATKKKIIFFEALKKSEKNEATKLEGGGVRP